MISHSPQTHRANREIAWLTTLIGAMEKVSRSDTREFSCDDAALAGLAIQLAGPVTGFSTAVSDYSLRN